MHSNTGCVSYSDRKEIGKTGEYVSSIGLGTWSIRDYKKAFEVFMYALREEKIDHIDTAEMYDDGKAEEFVGRIIKVLGKDKVFVTTKMLPHHLFSEEEVLKAAKRSLKRLGVSEVDLFLIHWPNFSIPIEQQVRNFEVVYLNGLARYIGVSNFDVQELEKALTATKKAEIVVDQVHYSVHHRLPESNDLIRYSLEKGITIQAYTPIERGKVLEDSLLKSISAKMGKTPVQIALNYIISQCNVVAIVKTENKDHLNEIIGSMGWRLPPDIIDRIKTNS